jgi:hypothetical protein
MESKKKRERGLLEQFLAASKIEAEIVDGLCEAPDFILLVGGQRVGIELTELFVQPGKKRDAPQARESLANKIVLRAREIYLESGSPPAYVSVRFASNCNVSAIDGKETAEQIAALVKLQKLSPGKAAHWRSQQQDSTLPDAIYSLNMIGVTKPEKARWVRPSGGWAFPMTKEVLQKGIDKKSNRLTDYTKVVSTNWLLLVSGTAKPSQFFEHPKLQVATSIQSPFDRTYYFGQFDKFVVALGLSPK